MKKTLCIIFSSIFMLSAQIGECTEQESLNTFEIPIAEIPAGSGAPSGLSNGAITAITLGSVFGGLGLLTGVGYFFIKHKAGLTSGAACGSNSPYTTICISDDSTVKKLKLSPEKNKYIIRALEKTEAKECSRARFLLIPDTTIKNKTYNTLFFELPEINPNEALNFRIIQASEPYELNGKMPTLDTKILLNVKSKDLKESATTVEEADSADGILIKRGQITTFRKEIASINTYFDSDDKTSLPKAHAIVVEFY